jgi:hypothetical protein
MIKNSSCLNQLRKRIQHIKNELITQKMSSTHKNQNFKRNHLKKIFLCGEFLTTKSSPLTSYFLCGLFYFYLISIALNFLIKKNIKLPEDPVFGTKYYLGFKKNVL